MELTSLHGFSALAQATGKPTRSLSFAASSSQYLSITKADFGEFDRAKWAFSVWYKRASTGADMFLLGWVGAATGLIDILFSTDDLLGFQVSPDDVSSEGMLWTTATFTDTASFHHLLFHYDSANVTSGDRMRIWHDGAEITSFAVDTAPTAPVYNGSNDLHLGQWGYSYGYFDGLLYQPAFFSGVLPDIGQIYNAGAARDISTYPNVRALLNTNAIHPLEEDFKLGANWTNSNSVTISSTIP